MYDRKFWNWFKEAIGLEFDKFSAEKPIIYYAGMTEDHIDATHPTKCAELKIKILEKIDFIVCLITYTNEGHVMVRKVLIPFTDIEEVQTIKTVGSK